MKTLEHLSEAALYEVSSAESRIKSFADKMLKDPAYELAWGGDAFSAAARIKVWSSVHAYIHENPLIADEIRVENVKKEAMNNVIRGARYPERSTSPTSNLMAQEVTVAWSSILELLSR